MSDGSDKLLIPRITWTYSGFEVDQSVGDACRSVEGWKEFLGDVFGLVSEHDVTRQRVAGQQTADVSDVRFKHRKVAALEQIFHRLEIRCRVRVLHRVEKWNHGKANASEVPHGSVGSNF